MILALTGSSLTGKTTLGRQIAGVFNLPLRVCGDEVRRAAAELRVDLGDVPVELHRQIDDATREWAERNQPSIVDGRFLDYVLGPATKNVLLIRLESGEADRQKRSSGRAGRDVKSLSVVEEDSADAAHVARLYFGTQPAKPTMTLDTNALTPDACLEILKPFLTNLSPA